MLAGEELVGRQKREVEPGALISVDPPLPGRRPDSRIEPPAFRCRNGGEGRGERVVDLGGKRAVPRGDEARRVRHRVAQRPAALGERRRDGEHARPCGERLRRPADALEALSRADQRGEVACVERQRAVERRALAGIVAEQPPRLGEVEPQRQPGGIEVGGAREQVRRRCRIAGVQPCQTFAIERLRRRRARRHRMRCAVTGRIVPTRRK